MASISLNTALFIFILLSYFVASFSSLEQHFFKGPQRKWYILFVLPFPIYCFTSLSAHIALSLFLYIVLLV